MFEDKQTEKKQVRWSSYHQQNKKLIYTLKKYLPCPDLNQGNDLQPLISNCVDYGRVMENDKFAPVL